MMRIQEDCRTTSQDAKKPQTCIDSVCWRALHAVLVHHRVFNFAAQVNRTQHTNQPVWEEVEKTDVVGGTSYDIS